jgi:hypothetical protein
VGWYNDERKGKCIIKREYYGIVWERLILLLYVWYHGW